MTNRHPTGHTSASRGAHRRRPGRRCQRLIHEQAAAEQPVRARQRARAWPSRRRGVPAPTAHHRAAVEQVTEHPRHGADHGHRQPGRQRRSGQRRRARRRCRPGRKRPPAGAAPQALCHRGGRGPVVAEGLWWQRNRRATPTPALSGATAAARGVRGRRSPAPARCPHRQGRSPERRRGR